MPVLLTVDITWLFAHVLRQADTGSGFAGIAKKFCLTGMSSMAAEGATFPIDITKTRLQLQGQADFTGTKFGFGGMMVNILKRVWVWMMMYIMVRLVRLMNVMEKLVRMMIYMMRDWRSW